MLSEIKGSENKFNASTFMVDQSAAKINSIAGVYEEGWKKSKTCKWHYLHNAAHHLKQLPGENIEPFMKLAQDLCSESTLSVYMEKLEEMVHLCGK